MRAATIITFFVLLSAASASAQDAPVRNRFPRQGERRTTLATLDLQSLPAAAPLPNVLDEGKKPTSFPLQLPEATDLRFQHANGPSYVRWKATKYGSIYGHLEPVRGTSSVRLARDILQGYHRGPNIPFSCSNEGGAVENIHRLVAIRWERLQISPDGAAVLEVNDGWFDGRDCKAYVGQKSTFSLKPILFHEETPLLFASRTEEGLLLHFPPSARVVSDAGGGTSSAKSLNSLRSVWVPIRKGQASSVLAELNPYHVVPWIAQLQGKIPQPIPANHRQIQIGVEVLQAVRDQEPTILLRLTV
ncbi:MAG: hypothetical protein RMJ98_22590 [Myxococcales bacterium]|nr:hypothetical protein [Polyangiaceae bacterium]MDW8252093.1 hypothetical protein [Myxococcales bacterium]